VAAREPHERVVGPYIPGVAPLSTFATKVLQSDDTMDFNSTYNSYLHLLWLTFVRPVQAFSAARAADATSKSFTRVVIEAVSAVVFVLTLRVYDHCLLMLETTSLWAAICYSFVAPSAATKPAL